MRIFFIFLSVRTLAKISTFGIRLHLSRTSIQCTHENSFSVIFCVGFLNPEKTYFPAHNLSDTLWGFIFSPLGLTLMTDRKHYSHILADRCIALDGCRRKDRNWDDDTHRDRKRFRESDYRIWRIMRKCGLTFCARYSHGRAFFFE